MYNCTSGQTENSCYNVNAVFLTLVSVFFFFFKGVVCLHHSVKLAIVVPLVQILTVHVTYNRFVLCYDLLCSNLGLVELFNCKQHSA